MGYFLSEILYGYFILNLFRKQTAFSITYNLRYILLCDPLANIVSTLCILKCFLHLSVR